MRKLTWLLVAVGLSFVLYSCKLGRFVVYNFADIGDHRKFPSRPVIRGESTFTFTTAEKERAPKELEIKGEKVPFDRYLADNKTVAFLVIRNDTLLYERYWDGYEASSVVPSFSMAKSVTSILIGCAIDDGLIQSVNDPVTRYIPELAARGFDRVTLEHLLQMTSGLDFNESYVNPFGHAASFYYGTRLRKEISKLKLKEEPGKSFDYVSGNTQLLGLVLERALKNRTVTDYLEEKLWRKMGMEYDASWSIDRRKNGLEKTFCCLNARARDFAKIGRLYLNKGRWMDEQIVAQSWVEQSTRVDTSQGSAWFYQYQWWLPSRSGDFMAEGILGQYIYVNPNKNLIIVRLGRSNGKANWERLFTSLAAAY